MLHCRIYFSSQFWWIVLLLFFSFQQRIIAQHPFESASIKRQIAINGCAGKGYEDTSCILLLCKLSRCYYSSSADSMRITAEKALALSEKMEFGLGQTEALRMLAASSDLKGDLPNQFKYLKAALSLAEKLNKSEQIAKISSNLGGYFIQIEQYNEAEKCSKRALSIYQQLAMATSVMGELSNLGDVYFYKKNIDSARMYQLQAQTLAHQKGDAYSEAFISSALGKLDFAQQQYRAALQKFSAANSYYYKNKDQLGICQTGLLMGQCLDALKIYDEAIQTTKPAFSYAKLHGLKKEIKEGAKILSNSYEQKGDVKAAFAYLKIHKLYTDSLYSEETIKKNYEIAAKYEYATREKQLETEHQRKSLLVQSQLNTQRLETILALVSTLLVLIIATLLYFSRASKIKLNESLEQKNNEIEQQKEILVQQSKALQVNNQFKDKLFSIVSHDIKSPLNSLKMLLSMMQAKRMSEEDANKLMTMLQKQIATTTELVSTLFGWAKSQLEGFRVQPTLLYISAIVDEVAAPLLPSITEKQLRFSNQIKTAIQGYADKDMLQTIIRNLLSNAIKFCHPGDSVTIKAREVSSMLEVTVSDTGVGIPAAIMQKIQNQESITTVGTLKEKGTGLGLLLCKEFVEKNGGTFHVNSTEGKGSDFVFTLPAAMENETL